MKIQIEIDFSGLPKLPKIPPFKSWLALLPFITLLTYSATISVLPIQFRWIGGLVILAIGALEFKRKERASLLLAALTGAIVLLVHIPYVWQWPFPSLFSALVFAIFLLFKKYPPLKLKEQNLAPKEWGISVLVGLLSIAGVVCWFLYFKPSTATIPFRMLNVTGFALYFGLAVFCGWNAFAEELLFRAVAMSALTTHFSGRVAVVMQALAFEVLHLQGFPFGYTGAILGGVFALVLGWLRLRTRGLFLPWLSHWIADLGIGILLVHLSQSST